MVTGARHGEPADAIQGVVPRQVVEPATVEEAAEVLAACARDRLSLTFVGGGTELELGAPPRALDVLLRTTRLARVVEYAPSDQIAVVEAGLSLAALGRRLAEHRQRLALDPPQPERATLGGIVASNAFGPLRHRFGSARDLVVGMGFVRADGTPAKGGGKVVKNVAGFDLPRLLVGSLGTLALLTTVAVRLHPLPEAEATVRVDDLDAERTRALARALRAERLEPASLVGLLEESSLGLLVRLEGFAAGLAAELGRLRALLDRAGYGHELLDEAAARPLLARHEAIRAGGPLRVKATAPPSSFPALLRSLEPIVGALGGGAAALYPTLGVAFASGRPGGPEEAVRAIERARAALAPLSGSLVLCAAPPEVRADLDPWGPPPPALGLMRAVKDRLDPDHRLAPGRFVGGI